MKMLGLIGGMSWESSAIYYRLINQYVQERLGGLHSANILLRSFNFEPIAHLQAEGHWQALTDRMIDAGRALKHAGADALMICTNTMHKIADAVENNTQLPLIHIADSLADGVKTHNITKVGLLATKFTMEETFYTRRLQEKHRIESHIPDPEERMIVHRVIFEELCKGMITPAAKKEYLAIIDRLIQDGAQGIVLACTEIGMLIKAEDIAVPLFDTTALHAKAGVDYMLSR